MINRNGLITLRRMMLILTLSVSVIFPFSPMHDVVCAGSAKAMEPEHHKTITYDADRDTYTVKLNVIGKEETVVGEKPKVDVVFVLDTSGSMKYSLAGDWWWSSEPSRLDILKRSLTSENGMLKQLLDDDKKDCQVTLVNFDNSAAVQGPTSDLATAKYYANNLSAHGGTSLQFGLMKANNLTTREGAAKYIVLLSDGEPTYGEALYGDLPPWYVSHGQREGYYDGHTWYWFGNGQTQMEDIRTAAYRYVNRYMNPKKWDGFYTIGYTSGSGGVGPGSFLEKLTQQSTAPNRGTYAANNHEELNNAFAAIQQQISVLNMSNVSISDPLSDAVEFSADAAGNPQNLQVKVYDRNGRDVTAQEGSPQAVVDKQTKKVSVNFGNSYKLKAGYKYELSFDVKVSQQAWEQYFASGKTQFVSNGDAVLTYTYDGTERSVNFTKPEFDLAFHKLTVAKKVEGKTASAYYPDKFSFKLTVKDLNGSPFNGKLKNADNEDVTFANGTATIQLKDGEKLEIPKFPHGYSYSVEETKVDNVETEIKINGAATTAEEAAKPHVVKKDNKAEFTNTLKEVVESGVAVDRGKSMLVAAGALGLLLLLGTWFIRRMRIQQR